MSLPAGYSASRSKAEAAINRYRSRLVLCCVRPYFDKYFPASDPGQTLPMWRARAAVVAGIGRSR